MPLPTHSPTPIGFHYFPDSEHYTRQDLDLWLPILASLKANYLTLLAPASRAVPEFFLQALCEHQIEPILHLKLPLGNHIPQRGYDELFKAYANWGVRYLVLFDRPNLRATWQKKEWNQSALAAHFLDLFLPLAEKVIHSGLIPVYPPLEPGGDYWDTSFLRSSLLGILKRGKEKLLEKMALGSYGYVHENGWKWGKGGPDRWPEQRPYFTPTVNEDHRGFYIYQWYAEITRAVTGMQLPILQLRSGRLSKPLINVTSRKEINEFYRLYMSLQEPAKFDQQGSSQSTELVANCFWILSAEDSSRYSSAALFTPFGQPSLPAKLLTRLALGDTGEGFTPPGTANLIQENLSLSAFPLPLYVLLPKNAANGTYSWLSEIHNLFSGKNIPVGNSPLDASLARKVFLTGKPSEYPDTQIQYILKAGCEVVACSDSGIELAQTLASI
jgi:hypothetical protein